MPKKKVKESKKVTKEATKKTLKKVVKKTYKYKLVMSLNDKVYKEETNDLAKSIMSYSPEFLRTKLIITVTKDKRTCERVLYLNNGKRLFNNRYTLESLIKNLIF